MKMFAFADLHGNIEFLEQHKEEMKKADGVFFAGDFFPYKSSKEEFFATAKAINEILEGLNLYYVWGNVDFVEAKRHNVQLNEIISVGKNINMKKINVGSVSIIGFDYFEFDTDLRVPEKIFPADVFLSHLPPKNTIIDKTFMGTHIGSALLKQLALEHKPKIWICGHVHEAKGSIMLGSTIVYNIGPAKTNNFLILDV